MEGILLCASLRIKLDFSVWLLLIPFYSTKQIAFPRLHINRKASARTGRAKSLLGAILCIHCWISSHRRTGLQNTKLIFKVPCNFRLVTLFFHFDSLILPMCSWLKHHIVHIYLQSNILFWKQQSTLANVCNVDHKRYTLNLKKNHNSIIILRHFRYCFKYCNWWVAQNKLLPWVNLCMKHSFYNAYKYTYCL